MPTLQSRLVGMVGVVLPLAEPHTPFVTGGVPVIWVAVLAASALLASLLSATAKSTSAMAPRKYRPGARLRTELVPVQSNEASPAKRGTLHPKPVLTSDGVITLSADA